LHAISLLPAGGMPGFINKTSTKSFKAHFLILILEWFVCLFIFSSKDSSLCQRLKNRKENSDEGPYAH